MKQLLPALFFFIFISFLLPKNIYASNNIFGVHILFPEEVKEAAELVNSKGGDWGYVVIPIQATDRNFEKWQAFMDSCASFHLIPIIRLATYPSGNFWQKPGEFESVDFANFLNSLNWPTKKKIVAVYNEPNHAAEWGGEVNPEEYSDVLSDTIDQFKRVDPNFVLLNAALDASSADSASSMDEYEFMTRMILENPDIFQKIDGFNSHSYPNPNFSINPLVDTRFSIVSYQHEISFLQNNYNIYGLKVYITETGWKKSGYLTREQIAGFFKIAYSDVWTDTYIQVVAPFLLKADAGDFVNFSLIDKGTKTVVYNEIQSLKKTKGTPELENKPTENQIDMKFKEQKISTYTKQKTPEPLKFKEVWKKIINWVLR